LKLAIGCGAEEVFRDGLAVCRSKPSPSLEDSNPAKSSQILDGKTEFSEHKRLILKP
jgi:hypothetical protein